MWCRALLYPVTEISYLEGPVLHLPNSSQLQFSVSEFMSQVSEESIPDSPTYPRVLKEYGLRSRKSVHPEVNSAMICEAGPSSRLLPGENGPESEGVHEQCPRSDYTNQVNHG